jgi:hypothetical protein
VPNAGVEDGVPKAGVEDGVPNIIVVGRERRGEEIFDWWWFSSHVMTVPAPYVAQVFDSLPLWVFFFFFYFNFWVKKNWCLGLWSLVLRRRDPLRTAERVVKN